MEGVVMGLKEMRSLYQEYVNPLSQSLATQGNRLPSWHVIRLYRVESRRSVWFGRDGGSANEG
jgi:hypothetical protein